MDNTSGQKESLRSPQDEITAGMTVPANTAGDRWRPGDKIHENCREPGALPEPAVSACAPIFPANFTLVRQKLVSFQTVILLEMLSEHFCSSSPVYHTVLFKN